MIRLSQTQLATFLAFAAPFALGASLPEPGLVMYGAVRNTANSNAQIISGTLTWTITPASGSSVTITTPLTDISGQYSYALRVPFASVVGSSTLPTSTLQLNSTTTSYVRTNVFLTVNGTNYPGTLSTSALNTFTFGPADRGRLDEVDLIVNAPGITGVSIIPAFVSTPHFANGQFQLTMDGNIGQSYNLLASTDLINWITVTSFVCTNSSMVLFDPATTNFSRRFYKISQ